MRLVRGGPAGARGDPGVDPGVDLDRDGLTAVYAHPPGADPRTPFVRVNFVSSADGAVSAGGVSGGLHAEGDAEVFGLLRELADVVLVGAGTVRAEGYRGARTSSELRDRRRARGQGEVPPIAVVSGRGGLDPSLALFTDTSVPPLVLTAATAADTARATLAPTGAEVVAVSTDAHPDAVDTDTVLDALATRGLCRVLCEGGPSFFGSLAAADRVDELCLSLAPQLAGGGAQRIIAGPTPDTVTDLRLASVVGHGDALMLRYRTPRGDAADPPTGT